MTENTEMNIHLIDGYDRIAISTYNLKMENISNKSMLDIWITINFDFSTQFFYI